MLLRRFILLCTIMATAIALKEGDPCKTEGHQSGVCQLQSSCAEYPKMKLQGTRPKICGYNGEDKETIICCPTLQDPVRKHNLRKSELYCEEWREIATREKILELASLNAGEKRKILVPDCNIPSWNLLGTGDIARNGEFPHMAALGWFNDGSSQHEFKCGGSLISDRYVLTAGHCVYGNGSLNEPDIVRLGDNDLYSTEDGLPGSDFKVKRVIRHPDYKPTKGRYNDIALIELNQTVEFDSTIRPACLWPSAELDMSQAIATGYGDSDYARDHIVRLLKVELELLGSEECSMFFPRNKTLPKSVIESQLCAYDQEAKKDTCQGDSGGPLQVTLGGHKCLYYIVGITSFGNFCGGVTPAVYTKVSSYLDWIESEVWSNDLHGEE